MRYRPFGRSGSSISAVTLTLDDRSLANGPEGGRALIYAALEGGVNSFHLASADPVLAELVGEALAAVERRLVFVALRLGVTRVRNGVVRDFSAEALTAAIDRTLQLSRLGHLDLIILDEPADTELPQSTLNALKAMRSTGRVRLLGVSGRNDAMDAYVTTNAFDVLVTPFNVNADWRERNRIRMAVERDMGVLAYDYFPEALDTPRKIEAMNRPKRRLFGPKPEPLADAGTFAFLYHTPNWRAEDICLAFALTEPTLSSVLVDAAQVDRVESLTAVPDRDLPPGLAAQIEMARVRGAA